VSPRFAKLAQACVCVMPHDVSRGVQFDRNTSVFFGQTVRSKKAMVGKGDGRSEIILFIFFQKKLRIQKNVVYL